MTDFESSLTCPYVYIGKRPSIDSLLHKGLINKSATERVRPESKVIAGGLSKVVTSTKGSPLKPLTNTLAVTAKGGHRVTLIQKDHKWLASVDERLPIGFKRRITLPVYGDPKVLNLAKLANHDSLWYQHHIQVVFPE